MTAPFKSFIGDFSQADLTVFNRTLVTHWKPVMMVNRAVVQYLLYMTIQRTKDGEWYLQVRTFSPDSMIDRIKVRLEVFKSNRKPITAAAAAEKSGSEPEPDQEVPPPAPAPAPVPHTAPVFGYSGGVVSSRLTNEEVLGTGRYLLLSDAQMKCLKTEETIFEYKVDVTIERGQKNVNGSL